MNRFQQSSPNLMENETIEGKFTKISIGDDSGDNFFDNTTLTLTTHRIIIELKSSVTFSLSLSTVERIESATTPRNLIKIKLSQVHHRSPFPSKADSIVIGHKKTDLKSILDVTLRKSLWKIYPHDSSFNISHVGIGGIARAKQAQFDQDSEAISTAFSDLKNLMELASTMTHLSRNLSSKLEMRAANQDSATVAFRSMLLAIGIDNPVTRGGSNYHSELSAQLHDFLQPLVEKCGGTMSLVEAFCYYNRARSMSLISPQDMLYAVERFSNIPGQKLFLKRFSSGSCVLQSFVVSSRRVAEDVKGEGRLTVEGYAEMAGISVFMARERLGEAEDDGFICRDESFEGVYYYWNIF